MAKEPNEQKQEQPTLDERLEGSEYEGAQFAFIFDVVTKSLAGIDTTLRVLFDQHVKILEQLCIINEKLAAQSKPETPAIVE